MPCFTPLKAYRAPGGGVAFDSKKGYSDRPFELACGQCRGCRAERARQWAVRCVHESQMHVRFDTFAGAFVPHNCFVTLTYSDKCLPPDGGLCVRDWQLFAKRVRKELGPFRFFHCGEYGDLNKRPHYHACMFGVDFLDRIYLKGSGENMLFLSPSLERLWGLGQVSVGNLVYESAAYVARYVVKKLTGERASEYGGRRAPYVTMSRRPGIGSTWFDKFMGDVYPSDEVVHKGKKHLPPKYYDSKLPEAELEFYKRKRRAAAAKRAADLSPERLRVRERIAEARDKEYERRAL